LQNSFRQVADATPVHYLRCVRLNAVRRQLMSTRAADLNIAQAAADRGFDHLSHFAERYKALFGELPSQTTRAADSSPTSRPIAFSRNQDDRPGLAP
jgi:transcriptional regulator GlxA family with amidase domain